jgi:site-specific recombinase XerD
MSNIVKRTNFSPGLFESKYSFDYKLEYEFFHNFESPHTRKSYRTDLLQLFEFISENFFIVKSYAQIERVHIVAYRNWLTDNNMAPKSINRKLAAASSFFDFLIEKGIVQNNPCSSIKRPRQEVQNATNDLSDIEIAKLLSLIDELSGPGLLHKAIIYTLFTTGIRKAELINLKLKNIVEKEDQHVIEIVAKGGKRLTKVLHPKCYEVIQEYLAYHTTTNQEKLHPEDWVFRPSKNPLDPEHILKPLNPKSVDYIIKSWCKKADIHTRISPHSARASYIGSALENGIDLYKISKDVGHSSVKTTEEYNKRRQKLSESPVFGLGFLKK